MRRSLLQVSSCADPPLLRQQVLSSQVRGTLLHVDFLVARDDLGNLPVLQIEAA